MILLWIHLFKHFSLAQRQQYSKSNLNQMTEAKFYLFICLLLSFFNYIVESSKLEEFNSHFHFNYVCLLHFIIVIYSPFDWIKLLLDQTLNKLMAKNDSSYQSFLLWLFYLHYDMIVCEFHSLIKFEFYFLFVLNHRSTMSYPKWLLIKF